MPKEWEWNAEKNENSNVVVRPSELKPLQRNVFLLCQSQEKRICEVPLFFRMFLKTSIHETRLPGIFQKFACFRSRRFPKPRISTVFRRAQKNASKISRKSTESRMTKRMGFHKSDLKSAKSTIFGRRVPIEWDFIFYQVYLFQKIPKRIRPRIIN